MEICSNISKDVTGIHKNTIGECANANTFV